MKSHTGVTSHLTCNLYCLVCCEYTSHEKMNIVSQHPRNVRSSTLGLEYTEDKLCLECGTHRQVYFPRGSLIGEEI